MNSKNLSFGNYTPVLKQLENSVSKKFSLFSASKKPVAKNFDFPIAKKPIMTSEQHATKL